MFIVIFILAVVKIIYYALEYLSNYYPTRELLLKMNKNDSTDCSLDN